MKTITTFLTVLCGLLSVNFASGQDATTIQLSNGARNAAADTATMPVISSDNSGTFSQTADDSIPPTSNFEVIEGGDLGGFIPIDLIPYEFISPTAPAIPYTTGVSNSGAYTINVPIDVFPGINDMQPNLSLAYNSQSGNGVVGHGWSVAGMSSISIRHKNIYYDGKVEPMNWSTLNPIDCPLALDGQKMIVTNAYSIFDGRDVLEYCLETTNAVKVSVTFDSFKRWGTVNVYYLASATVYYPDGKVAEYVKKNSAIQDNILLLLSKVTDKNGNAVQYKYVDDANSVRLLAIEYGENTTAGTPHFAKVEFTYVDRSDKSTSYWFRYPHNNHHLLSEINVFYNNILLHTYSLNYTLRHFSQLTKISLNSNGSNHQPIRFNYNAQGGYEYVSSSYVPGAYWENGRDFNMNYFSCRYYQNTPKAAVATWEKKASYTHDNGSEYGDNTIFLLSPHGYKKINTEVHFRALFPVDLNSVGRDQLVKVNAWRVDNTEQMTMTVYDANEADQPIPYGPFPLKDNLIIPRLYLAGDFDGNGKQEVLGVNAWEMRGNKDGNVSGGYIFDLNNSTNYFIDHNFNYRRGDFFYAIDMDGDGKTDIVRIDGATGELTVHTFVKNDNGTGCPYTVQSGSSIATPFREGDRILIGDINGDGMPDFFKVILFGSSWHCTQLLSNVSGPFSQKEYNLTGFFLSMYDLFTVSPPLLADFNNDGRSDLAVASTDKLYIFYSDGQQMKLDAAIKTGTGWNGSGLVTVVDSDLPNVENIVSNIYENNVTMGAFSADEQKSALLNSVSCKGITESVEYARWDKPETFPWNRIATAVPLLDYPYQLLDEPLWITTNVKSDQLHKDDMYFYGSAFVHKTGLGFCGFNAVGRKGTDTRGVISKKYSDPLRFGIPLKEETPEATLVYDNVSFNPAFPTQPLNMRINQTTQTSAVTGVKVKTYYQYDAYGNPTQTSKVSDGLGERTTVAYENRTTTPWLIGIPKKIETIKAKSLNTGIAASTIIFDENYASEKWKEVTTFAYDSRYNPSEVTKLVGEQGNLQVSVQQLTPDAFGQVVLQKEKLYNAPVWRQSASTYSPHGLLLATKDDRDNIVEYAYNAKGLLQAEWAYNSVVLGQIPGGNKQDYKTAYEYDNFRRLAKASYNNGMSERKITYSSLLLSGDICRKIEETNKPAMEIYTDLLERPIKERTQAFDGSWITHTKQYDWYGQVEKTTSPAGETVYTYDQFGRPTSVAEPTGSKTTYSYSNLKTTETKNGYTTTTTRNAWGETVSIASPAGTIDYSLRPDGQPKTITAGGVETSIKYDGYGRQEELKDPSAGEQKYEYDAAGRLWKQTNAKGQTTVMTYDNYDQLSTKTTPEFTVSYQYRHDGMLERKGGGWHWTYYKYDKYNRLINMEEDISSHYFMAEYKYTGNRIERVDYYDSYNSSGYSVHYGFNPRGFVNSISGEDLNCSPRVSVNKLIDQPFVSGYGGSFEYTLSNFNLGTYTEGFKIFHDSDKFGRAFARGYYPNWPQFEQDMHTSGYSTTDFFEEIYEYEAPKNLLKKRYFGLFSEGQDGEQWKNEYFTYDNHLRLTTYGQPSALQEVSYHNNGNIARKSRAGTYTYNAALPYALANVAGGNSMNIPAVMQDVSYTSFMRPASIHEGAYSAYFDYGSDDDRCRMEIYENGQKQFTRYYFAGGQFELTEYADGRVDRILYMDGSPYDATIAHTPDRENMHHFICRDRQGSVRAIMGDNGRMLAYYHYDPWGRQTDADGNVYAPNEEPALILGRGYTGHEHLPWFNLINMNARLYDPALGRFLSPDPFVQAPGELQNFNRYSYAMNNPLMYVDQDGEFFWLIANALKDFFRNTFVKVWDQGFNAWSDSNNWHSTTMSARMTAGLFKGDFGQILSRFTKELPQTLFGHTFSQTANLFDKVSSVEYWGGATVINNGWLTSGQGVTLGSFINGGSSIAADPNNSLFQHEYGHYLQSQAMGLAYLPRVGIPSLMSANGDGSHKYQPFEQDANARAFIYFNKHVDGFYKSFEDRNLDRGWDFWSNPLDVNHIGSGSRGDYYDYKNPEHMSLVNSLKLSAKWYDYVSWVVPIFGPIGAGIGNGIYYKNNRIKY